MMPLKGPNEEDVSKLHAEINLIVNQRFVLTTLALTLFGLFIVLMVPKDPSLPGANTGGFPFIVSITLSSLLFGIYLWSHLLKFNMRIFTTYLVETKKSGWELDWKEYRRGPYTAQTKPSSIIFLLINLINFLFPFVLVWIYSLNISSIAGPIVAVGVGVLTELLIFLMGFQSLFYDESKIVERWEVLNK